MTSVDEETTAARLAAIRARCEAASEGPWVKNPEGHNVPNIADVTFKSHAHVDIPWLLDENASLHAALAASQAREAALRAALEMIRTNEVAAWGAEGSPPLRASMVAMVLTASEKHLIAQALALPHDDTALQAALRAARAEEREALK